jgi:hypothetical protein
VDGLYSTKLTIQTKNGKIELGPTDFLNREISHNRRPAHQHGFDRLLPHNGQTTRLAPSLDVEIRSCCQEEGAVPGTEKRRQMIYETEFFWAGGNSGGNHFTILSVLVIQCQ